MNTESSLMPKKRGRKPKSQTAQEVVPTETPLSISTNTEEPVQRKRGRKKKYVIESIKKLRDSEFIEDKVEFDTVNENLDNLENKTHVSFGSMNITVHRDNPINKHELRKLFDTEFNLEEVEKVPNVLTQDDFEEKVETETKNYKILENCWNSVVDEETKVCKWPEKTNIWCNWCCHSFEGAPVPCPTNYDYIKNIFEFSGIFCSWECAAAHSIEKYNSLTNLYLLRKFVENKDTELRAALPKKCLKVFGGYMTIEDYRNNCDKKNLVFTKNINYRSENQYVFD